MGVIRSPPQQQQQLRRRGKQGVYKCWDWMAIKQFPEGRATTMKHKLTLLVLEVTVVVVVVLVLTAYVPVSGADLKVKTSTLPCFYLSNHSLLIFSASFIPSRSPINSFTVLSWISSHFFLSVFLIRIFSFPSIALFSYFLSSVNLTTVQDSKSSDIILMWRRSS